MSDRDPFEQFRRLNPIELERMVETDDAALASILDDDVVGSRGRRRGRQLLLGGIVVGAVAATAAWVALREEPVTNPLQVACHRTADVGSDRHVVAEAGDPVAACAAEWATGTFGTGPVPELTACTAESGTAAVFPGGADVCVRLGLAVVASTTAEQDGVRGLEDRLQLAFGPRCVPRDEAAAIAQQILDELHLTDWTVEVTAGFSEDRPCTASGVDARRRTVSIGGLPANGLVPSAPAAP